MEEERAVWLSKEKAYIEAVEEKVKLHDLEVTSMSNEISKVWLYESTCQEICGTSLLVIMVSMFSFCLKFWFFMSVQFNKKPVSLFFFPTLFWQQRLNFLTYVLYFLVWGNSYIFKCYWIINRVVLVLCKSGCGVRVVVLTFCKLTQFSQLSCFYVQKIVLIVTKHAKWLKRWMVMILWNYDI